MGYLRSNKKDIPLRSIVSRQGSVSYGVAKELARISKPLTGNSNHQVLNSKEFADDIKKIKLEEGECIMSYDVAALFTSIPVKSAQDTQDTRYTRYRIPPENHHVHPKHHGLVGDLPLQHLFLVPRQLF